MPEDLMAFFKSDLWDRFLELLFKKDLKEVTIAKKGVRNIDNQFSWP